MLDEYVRCIEGLSGRMIPRSRRYGFCIGTLKEIRTENVGEKNSKVKNKFLCAY